MTSFLKISLRYAKALLAFAIEKKSDEAVFIDMQEINTLLKNSKELKNFLKNPLIPPNKKLATINKVFSKQTKVTNLFFELLVRKKREYIIPQVALSFISLYKESKNIIEVEVTSVNPLNSKNKTTLNTLINNLYPKKSITLKEKTDASLIGGVIFKADDLLFDASIKSTLNKTKIELSKNHYQKKL